MSTKYLLITALLTFTYSQCNYDTQPECENYNSCNWVLDIESGHCSNYNSNWSCNNASEQCGWTLSYGGSYGQWSYSCSGGAFEIDNSYCQENPDFIQGDLNGDLILNVLDVIIIVDIILNQESSDLADINGDGIVNILDVIELVDLILE